MYFAIKARSSLVISSVFLLTFSCQYLSTKTIQYHKMSRWAAAPTNLVTSNINNRKGESNKKTVLDLELTRIMNELEALQKLKAVTEEVGTEAEMDDNDINDVLETETDNVLSSDHQQSFSAPSNHNDPAQYKTPKNSVHGDHYPTQIPQFAKISSGFNKQSKQQQRETMKDSLGESFISASDAAKLIAQAEDTTTPVRPQEDKEVIIGRFKNNIENYSSLKRAVSVTEESTLGEKIPPVAKYMRVNEVDGRIISAYYTPGAEEKLFDFEPFYVNIGNKNYAKELISVKRNSQFSATGGKGKSKNIQEVRSPYLVVAFENRRKPSSPFVEYPLSRLDGMIKAIQELKNVCIARGCYKEGNIMHYKYPENTIIQPGYSKDTQLNIGQREE